ncbi:MAG: LysR family transcriptional regulator [Hydrocarboniphaga sp.]|uniref:LysR family transcriptional regulator n=1 Tax=Hydrocarboniphaga sp. TaxID=2033016 RepID=UPI002635FDF3|nr:LysR family transcriptional regulator [Hydrocarboniphaga sp.]MDB5970913.1 LysR family transcriptional regulator [Hydrocarboniphaga sp.]
MNLNHLAIFQAVASSGSVSGGARELHISQSAVSKQLGEFEKALGLLLFDRLPRGVRPTEAGQLLLVYANRLFAIESEAEAALGDLQRLARGRIAIGSSRTIGAYLLPPLLAAFRRSHPDVELSLQVDNTKVIETKLLAGEIDIGFAEGTVSSEFLDYHVFAQDELVVIAAATHPVCANTPVPLSVLTQNPLLMHEVGSGTREITEQALAAKKIQVRPAMTLASTEAIKQTVATGIGLGILSALAIRTEVDAGILAVVPVKGLRMQRPLYRIQMKNAWISPSMRAFLDLLEKSA